MSRFLLVAVLASITLGCAQQELRETAGNDTSELKVSAQLTVDKFWGWFAERASDADPLDEAFQRELGQKLSSVHADLTYELKTSPQPFELVISAGGIKSVFPSVRELAAAAPEIEGWKVIAFKQPKDGFESVGHGSTSLSLEDVRFLARQGEEGEEVAFFVRDLSGSGEELIGLAFVLIDALIGEEAATLDIAEMDFFPLAEAPSSARPFAELKEVIPPRE